MHAPVHITEHHTSRLGEVTAQLKLNNTTVLFFPANVTAILQPNNQGVIRCLKAYYCQKLIARIDRGEIESVQDLNKTISHSDALVLLRMALTMVIKTISNCWAKGGFRADAVHLMPNECVDDAPVSHQSEESQDEELLAQTMLNEMGISMADNGSDDEPNLPKLTGEECRRAMKQSKGASNNNLLKLD